MFIQINKFYSSATLACHNRNASLPLSSLQERSSSQTTKYSAHQTASPFDDPLLLQGYTVLATNSQDFEPYPSYVCPFRCKTLFPDTRLHRKTILDS